MADRAGLEAMIARAYAPAVLVQASPAVEAAARRNGLSVVDLLRPFVELKGLSFQLRGTSKPTTLTEFSVRLFSGAELACATTDAVEPLLNRAVTSAAAGGNEFGFSDASIATPEDAAHFAARGSGKGGKGGDTCPAFSAYRRELYRSLRCLPQEQRDYPIAMLVLASTADAAPVVAMRELASPAALPRPFQVDLYDPEVPRFYVLLHDVAGGAAALPTGRDPGACLRDARIAFPPSHVFALAINAAPAPVVPDIWSPLVGTEASPAAGWEAGAVARRGGCLTAEEVSALRGTVGRILVEGVLPTLEARIFSLGNVLAASRKGLRDVVRSWWRTDTPGSGGGAPGSGASLSSSSSTAAGIGMAVAGQALSVGSSLLGAALGGGGSGGGSSVGMGYTSASSGPPSSGAGEDAIQSAGSLSGGVGDITTVSFPYGALEAQVRLLADLCLAVKDYEGAAAHYRRLRDELRPDRHPTHYASACEGAALATLLASGPSRECDVLLETAVTYFHRAAGVSGGGSGAGDSAAVAALGLGAYPQSGGAVGAGGGSPAPGPPGGQASSSPGAPPSAGNATVAARRLALRLASRAGMLAADAALATVPPPGSGTSAAVGGQPGAGGGGTSSAAAGASAGPNARCREASTLLRRLASVEAESGGPGGALAAALLTEQAALALLRCSPPSHRKAAAALMAAGASYGACGQPRHAARCLSLAMSSYGTDGSWALLEDAAVMALAGRLSAQGDFSSASSYLAHCLSSGGSRVPPPTQRTLLTALLRAFAQWEGAAAAAAAQAPPPKRGPPPPPQLLASGVPRVDDRSFEVVSWGNAAAAALGVSCGWNGAQGTPGARALCASVLERLGLRVLPEARAVGDAPTVRLPGLLRGEGGEGEEGLLLRSVQQNGCVRPAAATAGGGVGGAGGQPSAAGADVTSGTAAAVPAATCSDLLWSLWDGSRPGEGPAGVPATQQPWAALEAAMQRDLRVKEKLGEDAFRRGGGAPPPGTSPAGEEVAPPTPGAAAGAPALDWVAMCHDAAAALEDEAESAATGRRAPGGGLPGGAWAALAATPALVGATASTASSSAAGAAAASALEDPDGDGQAEVPPSPFPAAASCAGQAAPAAGTTPRPGAVSASSAAAAAAPYDRLHAPEAVVRVQERPAGEAFSVSFTLTNPLSMELPVIGLHLTHRWLPAAGGEGEGPPGDLDLPSSAWLQPSGHPHTEGAAGAGRDDVEVIRDGLALLPVDIVLAAAESRTVHLLARPLRTGSLLLTGVSWAVAGLVRCRHEWALVGAPLNDSRASKAASARAVDRRGEMRIVPPAAWASVQLRGFVDPLPVGGSGGGGGAAPAKGAGLLPESMAAPAVLDGAVRSCRLFVTNAGSVPLDSFLLRASGKGYVCVVVADGGQAQMQRPHGHDSVTPRPEHDSLDGLDGALMTLRLPRGASLLPGETASWRVHVRCSGAGLRTLRLMLWYGSSSGSGGSDLAKMRSARLCFRVRVQPSLSLAALCAPSPWVAGEYLLSLGVANVAGGQAGAQRRVAAPPSPSARITLSAVTPVSDWWELERLDERALGSPPLPQGAEALQSSPGAPPASPPLLPGDARLLTFIIRRKGAGVAAATGSSPCAGPEAVGLLRAERGHAGVAAVMQREQAREHAARRAAAAADALPPTLRSIAQGRAGASASADSSAATGGPGAGQDGGLLRYEDVAGLGSPLPSSAAALLGGRARLQLLVSWAGGEGGAAGDPTAFCSGQSHIVDLRTAHSGAVARGGAPWPAWAPELVRQLSQMQSGGGLLLPPPSQLAVALQLGGKQQPLPPASGALLWPLISVHLPQAVTATAPLPPHAQGAPGAEGVASVPVPVTVMCYNPHDSATSGLSFDLVTGASSALAPTALGPTLGLVAWEGLRAHTVRDLLPGERRVLSLRARVTPSRDGAGGGGAWCAGVCDALAVELLPQGVAGAGATREGPDTLRPTGFVLFGGMVKVDV